jgi:hypothetical protein
MTGEPFQDCPPDKPHVTGYDEAHLSDYLRLLDAEADGADWREAVSIIFDIDVAREPARAPDPPQPSRPRPLDDRDRLCLPPWTKGELSD